MFIKDYVSRYIPKIIWDQNFITSFPVVASKLIFGFIQQVKERRFTFSCITGCHWMWEALGMITNQTAEYTSATKDVTMLELTENNVIEKQPSPRILNTHVPLKYIPPQLLTKKCKMVYLLRNPKDVAASLYNHMYNLQGLYHYGGSWSGFLPQYISGNGNLNYNIW